MVLTRLLYFSETQIDPRGGARLAGLRDILAASRRNNKAADITGVLVFDDHWFLQALEGPRASVWATLKRIEEDERHTGLVVVDARQVEGRLFASWSMGLATRRGETAEVFAPYLNNGLLRPQDMTAAEVLGLMSALGGHGFARTRAAAA